MKKLTKLLGIVLIIALVMSMSVSAFAAVNITVNRDNTTYTEGGTEESGNRLYTYYQIFRATESTNHTSTGGGYDNDGTPGTVTPSSTDGISYYLKATGTSNDSTQIAELGEWVEATGTPGAEGYVAAHWQRAEGNNWFDLTPSADGTQYFVTWINENTDTDTAQEAARWLLENYTPLASENLTAASNGQSWTASDLPEGYYLLKSETGENLIAATADITVNEKNSYPTVDKKQKDSETGTFTDDAINVKIGDTVYYQVEVKVPANANADIVITDTMSDGLTYDITTDPVVKVGENALTADAGETKGDYVVGTKTAQSWTITIHPTAATKGQTVVITFAATVNNDALVQTNRKNDVEIAYGNYHQKDTVEHDIGAAAIIKYDGATADLDTSTNTLSKASGAEDIKYLEATFTLTDSKGTAINVKEATSGAKGVYVVDTTATTNTVTSDKPHNGVILIYGLDPDETYTLTETATEAGYNLLSGTVSLKPTKAETGTPATNTTKVTVAEASGISAGSSSEDAETLELTALQVNKVENNSGTVLPSTGGIGTTIFYVVGSVLVIAAGVLLVTKKRMGRD